MYVHVGQADVPQLYGKDKKLAPSSGEPTSGGVTVLTVTVTRQKGMPENIITDTLFTKDTYLGYT